MMPLPRFEVERPSTAAEAVVLLTEAGDEGRILAGGTDLLVNLKHGLHPPRLLVSLGGIRALRGVCIDDDGAVVVGSGETLASLAINPTVLTHAPSLAHAASRVAGPQLRRMGTLGGNLCLDVRCQYINRTEAWRDSCNGCIKSGTDVCHVVPGGRRCVAALSGDTVAPLVSLGADVLVEGPQGRRTLDVASLRTTDGAAPLALEPGELVVAVRIPATSRRRLSSYAKWAVRGAVDFPLVGTAVACELDDDGRIADLKVVISVLGPKPKSIRKLDGFIGDRLTAETASAVGALAAKQSKPLPNVLYETSYRQRLIGVLVRRQLEAMAAG
ncbi:MAG: 4-hydroxybenzoyl-CoA reductase beta subunit [Myxococcota bacterium]|jgi:4-hydroxybenzoyl-CoA reductase beta subunit